MAIYLSQNVCCMLIFFKERKKKRFIIIYNENQILKIFNVFLLQSDILIKLFLIIINLIFIQLQFMQFQKSTTENQAQHTNLLQDSQKITFSFDFNEYFDFNEICQNQEDSRFFDQSGPCLNNLQDQEMSQDPLNLESTNKIQTFNSQMEIETGITLLQTECSPNLNSNEESSSEKQTQPISIGKNVFTTIGKACKTLLKKKVKVYSTLNEMNSFTQNHFILPLSSRVHIISYIVTIYYFCKDYLKQNQKKTELLIKELIANRQSYNKKNLSNKKEDVQGNIMINKKILKFLNNLLQDTKLIQNREWVQEKVIEICFLTRNGKDKNKDVCRQQIQKLYEQIVDKKDYSGIFQAQKDQLKITY